MDKKKKKEKKKEKSNSDVEISQHLPPMPDETTINSKFQELLVTFFLKRRR